MVKTNPVNLCEAMYATYWNALLHLSKLSVAYPLLQGYCHPILQDTGTFLSFQPCNSEAENLNLQNLITPDSNGVHLVAFPYPHTAFDFCPSAVVSILVKAGSLESPAF